VPIHIEKVELITSNDELFIGLEDDYNEIPPG